MSQLQTLPNVNPCGARHEQGSALIVAVMMLALMGVVGLAAMDAVTQDRQSAGFQTRHRQAFYAAEAGASTALNLIRTASNRFNPPTISSTNLGNVNDYVVAQPSFRADPAFASPVRMVRDEPMAGMGLNSGFRVMYWVANVEGVGPAGGTARIEVSKRNTSWAGYR